MAFLSHADYLLRWNAPTPIGFGQAGLPPCYHEYLQREIYKQDYLDLYIYKRTFDRTLIDGKNYVLITGCPKLGGLEISNHDKFTINNKGNFYLLVDYDYPWNDKELKETKRCIEYVMIGEAAPANMAYFFYYILEFQEEKTLNKNKKGKIVKNYAGYVTAPFIAFFGKNAKYCNKKDKKDILLEFANKGVVLIDLFPFAVNYDKLRNILILKNNKSISSIHLNEINNKINKFKKEVCFKNEFKSVLVAPPKISFHLADVLNKKEKNESIDNILNFKLEKNKFSISHKKTNDKYYIEIPLNINLISSYPNLISYPITIKDKNGNDKTMNVPIYSCCGYSEAGTVPNTTFIKNALGLT